MIDPMLQVIQPERVLEFLGLLLGFSLALIVGLLPAIGALYVIYFLLTLPLRRTERARLFLDVLELGLQSGRTPEGAIIDASATHDPAFGARFHLLAAYLEKGDRLGPSLERVPRLLPPQITAMLKAGERIGDLGKVLPPCRRSLHGAVSHVRGALNYLLVLSFLATPFTIVIPLALKIKVLPAFRQVFEGLLEGAQIPPFTRFIFDNSSVIIGIQTGILLLVWLVTLGYLGGPRFHAWIAGLLPGGDIFSDWLLSVLPWRRKRLERDFSAMLAALLEAGVPEAEAVRLAGEATANVNFQRRAETAAWQLGKGVKLPDAIRVLDQTGELHWRLQNALRGQRGFTRALAGWHAALDAKAFQLEQTAAQLTTTFLVLLNGCVVAAIVIGMFLPLIQLLNRATLW